MTWWDDQTQHRQDAIGAVLDSDRGRDARAHAHAHAHGDREFGGWLLACDLICCRHVGVSIFDLADWTWRDAYLDGLAPHTALREALRAEGLDPTEAGLR